MSQEHSRPAKAVEGGCKPMQRMVNVQGNHGKLTMLQAKHSSVLDSVCWM